jgi:hypothetical protein
MLTRYPAGNAHTSACENFQVGDMFTQGTNKSDITCPVCLDIVRRCAS